MLLHCHLCVFLNKSERWQQVARLYRKKSYVWYITQEGWQLVEAQVVFIRFSQPRLSESLSFFVGNITAGCFFLFFSCFQALCKSGQFFHFHQVSCRGHQHLQPSSPGSRSFLSKDVKMTPTVQILKEEGDILCPIVMVTVSPSLSENRIHNMQSYHGMYLVLV